MKDTENKWKNAVVPSIDFKKVQHRSG